MRFALVDLPQKGALNAINHHPFNSFWAAAGLGASQGQGRAQQWWGRPGWLGALAPHAARWPYCPMLNACYPSLPAALYQ